MKTFKKVYILILISYLTINCKKDDDPVVINPIEVVENGSPSTPLLVLPEKESNLTSLVPNLNWEESTDPENETIKYDVFLGTDESNLTSVVSNLETTEYEIATNLDKGVTYYWNVVATDVKGNSTKSELFNFTTEYAMVNLLSENSPFSKRHFSTTTVFNDKIWVIGGQDESGNILSDIWSSSNGTDWTLVTDTAPFGIRKSHTTIVFQGKMWIYNGSNGPSLNREIWSTEDGVNWLMEENDSIWNVLPFYGQAHTTMFVFNNKVWRFAAYHGATGDLTTERNVWNSEDGKNWTLVKENHGFDKKYGMEVIFFQGKLIGIEGSTFNSDKFTKIWQSSNGIDWEVIAENLPFSFGFSSEAQILDNKLFITAGSGYSELWFTEDGINWQQAALEKQYPSRYANTTVVFQNKIYVVGGGTHADLYNDVWTIE